MKSKDMTQWESSQTFRKEGVIRLWMCHNSTETLESKLLSVYMIGLYGLIE